MNQNKNNDNAANRQSYVGFVYNHGENFIKKEVLSNLKKEWAELHQTGYIHIHDLDAYGLTYNCLTFNIIEDFPYQRFANLNPIKKIVGVFDYLKELFEKMGNEQSGGMALANFDNEIAQIFLNLDVELKGNEEIIEASISSLIVWCNEIHTRMGQTSYYITFNIGLANNEFARFLTRTLICEFEKSGAMIYKPNIVFKVVKGINLDAQDPNHDLLKLSLNCTSKKMIPTYLLCDCKGDQDYDPEVLSVMGCRTRVVDNLHDVKGAIGRSNIANISINLPRIAFDVMQQNKNLGIDEIYRKAKTLWTSIANQTRDILVDRYYKTCSVSKDFFLTNMSQKLWCRDFNDFDLKDIFKHGTLSIGFIGLNEFIQILENDYFWNKNNPNIYNRALNFVKYMRTVIDDFMDQTNLNFSLLATSGELISGRFLEFDKQKFSSPIFEKGFYTNSFHISVDSGIPAHEKITLEGKFHQYCNGGSISYIELDEAPLSNVEGLLELLTIAIEADVRYFGVNFPKDVCNDCLFEGTFDNCLNCNSKNITRIRRVSGYLEIADFFTSGKKFEAKTRKGN